MQNIFYELVETDSHGKEICRTQSPDALLCLSEILLKMLRPSHLCVPRGFNPDVHVIRFERLGADIGSDAHVELRAQIVLRESDDPLLTLFMTTVLSEEPMTVQMRSTAANQGGFSSYRALLETIRERMQRWTEGNIEASLILTSFASQDMSHGFWLKKNASGGGLSPH